MLMHRPQTPQPGIGSITLLQKFTPHFKILDPRLLLAVILRVTLYICCSIFGVSFLFPLLTKRSFNYLQTFQLQASGSWALVIVTPEFQGAGNEKRVFMVLRKKICALVENTNVVVPKIFPCTHTLHSPLPNFVVQ